MKAKIKDRQTDTPVSMEYHKIPSLFAAMVTGPPAYTYQPADYAPPTYQQPSSAPEPSQESKKIPPE